jgi:hypothetical protein
MQQKLFRRAQSIAGAVLVAVGILIFCESLDRTAVLLSRFVGAPDALGALPTLILAASRALEAYATDHDRFLQGLVHCILLTAWPLLLIIVGTVLSHDAASEKSTDDSMDSSIQQKKIMSTCRSDCRPFDARVEVRLF